MTKPTTLHKVLCTSPCSNKLIHLPVNQNSDDLAPTLQEVQDLITYWQTWQVSSALLYIGMVLF